MTGVLLGDFSGGKKTVSSLEQPAILRIENKKSPPHRSGLFCYIGVKISR